MDISLSVLDVVPVASNTTGAAALRKTLDLARLVDRLGYRRYWFAEHHNMPSIASSAPEVLIGHVAGATERIRVGAGGIMLPNHVPLQVAERFRTLEALYPGRIDLGIGRAPGTDPTTSRALRSFDANNFPQHLAELRAFSAGGFPDDHPFRGITVMPDDAPLPPIWILGSSGASARFAGQKGLGYAFASHFSPSPAAPALAAYRDGFEASEAFPEPHALLAVSVVCAETEARAEHLAAPLKLMRVRMQRGEFRPLPSPEEALAYDYTPQEQAIADKSRRLQVVGDPASVRAQIEARVEESGADEVMVISMLYDDADRLRSYELLADVFEIGDAETSRAMPVTA